MKASERAALYTSGQVAEIVGVVAQTIRDWSDEYWEYLSPGARPEKGAIRRYTEHDVRVFLTINRERDRRLPADEIVGILEKGDLVEEIPERIEVEDSVPASEHILALTRIDTLTRELQRTRNAHEREIERLVAEKERFIEERDQSAKERDEVLERLDAANRRIADLREAKGRVEGQLEQMQERLQEIREMLGDDRKRGGGIFGRR